MQTKGVSPGGFAQGYTFIAEVRLDKAPAEEETMDMNQGSRPGNRNRGVWAVAVYALLSGLSAPAETTGVEPFTFVQLCDPQLGMGGYEHDRAALGQAVAQINRLDPDFVVVCGDGVHDANASSLGDFKRIRAALDVPCYAVPGNHDVGNAPTRESLQAYRDAIGPDYYSVDHKGCRFVFVNSPLWKSPVDGESRKQDDWLARTLAEAAEQEFPVFIVGHYPLFVADPGEPEEYMNVPPGKRKELLDRFERSGVAAVLGGHTHRLVVNTYRGMQLVNGETTSRNFDQRPLGFRLWHVGGAGSYTHEFVALEDPAGAKPNVVLFYADDFGWGDLQCHHPDPVHFRYTPNLDRLFTEGIEFSNYMTHCVCSPSRAGLLTGKHYARVGAGPRTGGTLPSHLRNIARDFQDAGYATGAFGKWHNSLSNSPEGGNGARVDYNQAAEWNELHGEKTLNLTNNVFENHKGWKWGEGVNAYGFDRWVGYYNGGGDLFDRYVDWHHDVDWWHDRSYRGDETGYTTDLITRYAIEFIEEHRAEPFFCYIPQQAVHNPLQLKRSDLREFCEALETERGVPGQWAYVSNLVSPTTGNRIGDVAELRCDRGQEFDVYAIDPGQAHYEPLVYAAYVYTLDKSVGAVMQTIADIGRWQETIFLFASDNGATPKGINTPFRGGKHTLWEGGVHVPAAIWWPGTFDRDTAPYSPADHAYDGLISYLDIYPTLLSMAGQPCLGTDLDGVDCWGHLRARTECRPGMTDPLYGMWLDYGTIRTRRWKLHYSESLRRAELYDLDADIGETADQASAHPDIRDQLIGLYREWIGKHRYAMSYLAIDGGDIGRPAPDGDVLEVTATQTAPIQRPDANGVFVRFSNGSGWDQEYDAFIHAGDRVEFDIFVGEDSDITRGCSYTPGDGWQPFYTSQNGLNQQGIALVDLELPKGVWTHQVVGIGNYSPGTVPVNFIALRSAAAGTYHYYLDNIVIRRNHGGIRSVIWRSDADFAPLLYRYRGVNHPRLDEARAAKGFPFSDIRITTVDLESLK